MLLNDYKSIYIGNRAVKEIYYNNIKQFPLGSSDSGQNPFEIYSWQEIKDIVVRGEASKYIPLGTTFSFIIDKFQQDAIVVDYVYNNKPTLVVLVPYEVKDYWCSSGGSNVGYLSSYPYSTLDNIKKYIEDEFVNILCQRSISYKNPDGTQETIQKYLVLPSISEVSTLTVDTLTDHGMLEYFSKNPDYVIPIGEYSWTRTNYYSAQTYIWKGVNNYQKSNYYYYSNRKQYYDFFLLFIGE